MTRCQLCGRRRGLSKSGHIRHHHVAGQPCLGAGHPPIERDDARLVEISAQAQREAVTVRLEITAMIERRVNRIEPQLLERARATFHFAAKLERRLKRHRAWPRRFARQMERQGWGDPPPAYLNTDRP